MVKEALRLNAAAVIFSHNHSSGHSEPSQVDKVITQRLKEALALVDVRSLELSRLKKIASPSAFFAG